MRIIFLSHYASLYGANRSLLALIDGFSLGGLDSSVLLPSTGPLVEELEARGVPYRVFGFGGWMGRHRFKAPLRAVRNLTALPFVLKWVRKRTPAVIYTNSSVIPIGAYVSAVLNVPHVWHLREFGEDDYGLKRDFGDRWFRFWLGHADALISVSRALQEALTEGIDTRKYVVYNGVATVEQAEQLRLERESSRSRRSPFTFAIVGLLSPRKGQAEAIRALSRMASGGVVGRLLIAGSGPESYQRKLKNLVSEVGLSENVSFLGYVEDPFDVYRQADAVLMCSEREAMGRVTAEAMVASLPVIGRASGGTVELVTDGHNGLLYDGSVSELANCMEELARAPDLARKMGKRGWRRAKEEFVVEAYTGRIASVLREVGPA